MTWQVVGRSVTGHSHAKRAEPCQDACDWYVGPDVSCFVVADGAGSRSRSMEGAWAVCHSVVRYCSDPPSPFLTGEDLAFASVEFARKELESVADGLGLGIGELASTVAVVVEEPRGLFFAQIGDTIAAARVGDEVVGINPSSQQGYANETVFLTDRKWRNHIRRASFLPGEVTAVALSTDGLRLKVLDNPRQGQIYQEFFEDMFAYAEAPSSSSFELEDFLRTLDDQTGDDKSLVIAVNVQAISPRAAGGVPSTEIARRYYQDLFPISAVECSS